MADDWLTAAEAAKYLNYSAAHLARLRMVGGGPRYAKFGPGRQGQVRYRRADLDAWGESRMVASTSQQPAPSGT